MKVSIRRWLGFAALPAALLMFGLSGQANAQTIYTCSNGSNPVPSSVSGSANVVQSGDCILDHEITATGSISINAIDGSIFSSYDMTAEDGSIGLTATNDISVQGDLSSGTTVFIDAQTGLVNINGDIKSNVAQVPNALGNILIRANGNVATGSISTGGDIGPTAPMTGNVQIDANRGGGNTEFVIGGVGGANGINGTIDTRSTIGGDPGPTFIKGGVRITNGTNSSTGGIKVANSLSILVQNSASKSGWIILDAQNGPITLEGDVKSDGAPGQAAGAVFLFAKTVVAPDNVTVSASQDNNAPASGHQVLIAAETVDFDGATGITILSNGENTSSPPVTSVFILPQDAVIPMSNDNILTLLWTTQVPTPIGQLHKALTFDGGEGSNLKVEATGEHTQVFISGYPLKFFGNDVDIISRGKTDHKVTMGYFDQVTTVEDGIIFDNVGKTTINANAKNNGTGGIVTITGGVTKFGAKNHVVKADGPNNGDGNGGQIFVTVKQVILPTKADDEGPSKALFRANGPDNGTGAGGFIRFETSENIESLKLHKRDFSFAATGGMSGNGGIVQIINNSSEETRIRRPKNDDEPAINVSALNGNGGIANITGSAEVNPPRSNWPNSPDFVAIDARGKGTGGLGGTILIGKPKLNKVDGAIAVNIMAAFRVEGDDSLTPGSFDGKIAVDFDNAAVVCGRQRTGFNAFPKYYWNCVSPDNPGTEGVYFQNETNFDKLTPFKPSLTGIPAPNNPEVQLMVMHKLVDYYKFFYAPPKAPFDSVYGITNQPPNRVSVSFDNTEDDNGNLVPSSQDSGSSTILLGALYHEIGHQLGFMWSTNFKEAGETDQVFVNLVQTQNNTAGPAFVDMDALPCNAVFYQATCDQYSPQFSNSVIFRDKRFTNSKSSTEMWAVMFEHVLSKQTGTPPIFSQDPELEKALNALPQLENHMINYLSLSHTPQQ